MLIYIELYNYKKVAHSGKIDLLLIIFIVIETILEGEYMENRSKSGVLIKECFRDSLIIDKYDKVFHHWRQQKLEHLRSENSEDAMSWNVFRSLKQIDPSLWLPKLFINIFQKEFDYSCISIDVLLWEKLNPPITLTTPEGQTEVDIIIQSNDFVWFIEAKYKSDISMGTTLIRNEIKLFVILMSV